MEPVYSNKIVSLNLQKCSDKCPNASVCYLSNRGYNTFLNSHKLRKKIIKSGNIVYESLCSKYFITNSNNFINYYRQLLDKNKNFNITLSCNLLVTDLINYKNQIQVSVYNSNDILKFNEYQKLFLIKDSYSLALAYYYMKEYTGKLHFIIEQKFLSEPASNIKYKLLNFIRNFENRIDKTQTADTCLTSWLINGHCPYDNNYIDISYDSTIRKCPYSNTGLYISKFNDINELYNLKIESNCIYKQLFSGENNERSIKNTDS